jgi:hypothetical protein
VDTLQRSTSRDSQLATRVNQNRLLLSLGRSARSARLPLDQTGPRPSATTAPRSGACRAGRTAQWLFAIWTNYILKRSLERYYLQTINGPIRTNDWLNSDLVGLDVRAARAIQVVDSVRVPKPVHVSLLSLSAVNPSSVSVTMRCFSFVRTQPHQNLVRATTS